MSVSAVGRPSAGHDYLRFRGTAIQWSIAIVTTVIVIGPLLAIFYQSLLTTPLFDYSRDYTLSNYVALYGDPNLGRALWNTFMLALFSTVISSIIGVGFVVLVGRTNMPCRLLVTAIMISPLVLSHLVIAFGWFMSYGPAGYVTVFLRNVLGLDFINMYSMTGIVLVSGVAQAPITFLYCTASTALADPNLEDAARTCGARPMTGLFRITLPLMMPAIAYSAALSFASGLETLSMPLIFGEPAGIRFLTTILFTEGLAAVRPRHGLVAAVAILLVALGLLLIYVQRLILRNSDRYISVRGKATRPRVFDIGMLRWVALGLALLYLLLFIIVPIGMLVLRSFVTLLTPLLPFWNFLTTRWYLELLNAHDIRRAILNTFFVAGVGGVIATAYLVLLAVVVKRSNFRFSREFEYLALIPRAVPGIVAGIGIFYAILLFPNSGWIRNTLWVIILAYLIRYLPTGYGTLTPSILAISPDLDKSARTMGADWWSATYNTVIKIIRPATVSCLAILFIMFFKEYTIALYLFAPDTEVIGTKLLNFWVKGDMGLVAALSVFQIVVTLLFVLAARNHLGIRVNG